MFVAAVMVVFSTLMTWLPYRAWRKGVITVHARTSRRSREPKAFAFDLACAWAFTAICWVGTIAVIYRQFHGY